MNYREVFCLKKLFFRTASTLLGTVFLLSPAPVFAEETQVKYTPFSIKTGGTGATTVEQAKENLEIPVVVQTAGTSETSVMSQKAVTDAIAAGSGGGIVVTQASGQSTTNVMSQKAVTDALGTVSQPTVVQNTGQSVTSIMSQKAVTDALDAVSQSTVVQNTGTSISDVMSQKAVTDAINAIPQTTIVQTTGQAVNSVMSQKAVTDAILTAQTIFNMIWPVGSIYFSVNNVNPADLFGGTWIAWGSGRVPVGVDSTQTEFDTVSKTGGNKTHSHPLSGAGGVAFRKYGNQFIQGRITSAGIMPGEEPSGTQLWYTPGNSDTPNTSPNYPGIGLYGNTDNSSTLSPYITCYMWKRTA